MSWEHTTMGDCLGTPSALGMYLKMDVNARVKAYRLEKFKKLMEIL